MTSLPMISVRDLVLFPGGVRPIMVGREFTIASLKASIEKHEGAIIVTTQKYIELNERPSLEQIYQVGTLCKIIKSVDFPDGSMKVALQAEAKFRVREVTEVGGVRYGKGQVEENKENQSSISSKEKTAILEKIQGLKAEWIRDITPMITKLTATKEDMSFVMGVGHILTYRPAIQRQLTLEQIKEGIFMVDTLTAEEQQAINVGTARIQEILESKNTESALKKIKALI